jgi:hypothetical protein
MGSGGIDLIPILPGETRRQAVDRAYADAWFIYASENEARIEPGPGPERDVTYVTNAQHAWMLDARRMLEDLAPGWEVVEEHREPGRRWSWCQSVAHPTAPMWLAIYSDSAVLRHVKGQTFDDADFRLWWRLIRRFAAYPCVAYDVDDFQILATSMSAKAARVRYRWL